MKFRSVLWILCILPAALAWLSPGAGRAAEASLTVHIKQTAIVRGDSVTLGEIASFAPAGDPRVYELRALEVASAPSPGNSCEFNSRFLEYKVGSALSSFGEDIDLQTPSSLVVRRSAQVVTSRRMEEIFTEYLKREAPWGEKEMSLEQIRVPRDIALPEGTLHWEIRENGNADYLGNISATLTFFVDGSQIRRVPLSGRIAVTREVVRAAGRIRRGDVITGDDVEMALETSIRDRGDTLSDPGEAIGKRATRSIRTGTSLTAAMVESPPLVTKGSPVTIVAENSVVRITTLGEALEDGRKGDRIKVRNTRSGKEITSTVESAGWVKVFF